MKKIILCSVLSFNILLFSVNPSQAFGNSYKITQKLSKKINLIGNWKSTDDVLLVINNNGTLNFDGDTINYTISGNNIKVESEDGTINYPYKLIGDNLLITFPEGFEMSFKKISSKSNKLNNNNNQAKNSQNYILQGNFCSYSSSSTYSSSYSSQNKVFFDGNGKFYYGGGESSMSSNSGSYYGNSSSQSIGSYKISGKIVYLNNAEGETAQAQIHFVNSTGISELMYNGKLYGKGLCG